MVRRHHACRDGMTEGQKRGRVQAPTGSRPPPPEQPVACAAPMPTPLVQCAGQACPMPKPLFQCPRARAGPLPRRRCQPPRCTPQQQHQQPTAAPVLPEPHCRPNCRPSARPPWLRSLPCTTCGARHACTLRRFCSHAAGARTHTWCRPASQPRATARAGERALAPSPPLLPRRVLPSRQVFAPTSFSGCRCGWMCKGCTRQHLSTRKTTDRCQTHALLCRVPAPGGAA